ncbi:exonuclease domain-containing protein [Floccifex sp.]|uniref:exonuclease domain-containing protein n=1 Tax=Floccifex sp. TaxID=2815810 RepID=UPI003F09D09C
MKHIVIDLEMNASNCDVCRMEIIQIGAVVLDDQYQMMGSFSTLVKPQWNDIIEPFYESLTGISTEMVQNAPVFNEALYSFMNWIKNLNDEVEVLAWSESDLNQVLMEASYKEYEFDDFEEYVISQWVDFQNEFDHKLFIDHQCSLKDALDYAHIELEGNWHDALDDAKNTAQLLALLRDDKKCLETFGTVIEVQKVEKDTLGDLFDFSQFVFD